MNQPTPAIQLAENYHIDNFTVLLNQVYTCYQDLLNPDEIALYKKFHSLSQNSKSLYVRLLTRKGHCIRKDKLNYKDIGNLNSSLEQLKDAGLILINIETDQALLLPLLTKSELITSFPVTSAHSYRKPDLIEKIAIEYSKEHIFSTLTSKHQYISVLLKEAFRTYLLCFFGNTHQDMSEFVITDLGHVRYEPYTLCADMRFYQHRDQIDTHKHYHDLREHLQQKEIKSNSRELTTIANQLLPPSNHLGLQRRYEKLMITIARQLERFGEMSIALELYQKASMHPSQERQARILKKQKQPNKALDICKNILEQNQHPEAIEFAFRFGVQLAKQLNCSFPKRTLPDIAEHTLIIPKLDQAVELQVAQHLNHTNSRCFYVENSLFCSLFGLFFWDIIFTPIPGAFLNPFQRGPLQLHSEHFYRDRQSKIETRLMELTENNWKQRIINTFNTKQGIANYFVNWNLIDINIIQLALKHIPAHHLHGIFQRMVTHPGLYRNGFPDLICFSNSGYELLEVKAPGDTLQANQRRWFYEFNRLGIPAKVIKVSWQEPG